MFTAFIERLDLRLRLQLLPARTCMRLAILAFRIGALRPHYPEYKRVFIAYQVMIRRLL